MSDKKDFLIFRGEDFVEKYSNMLGDIGGNS